MVAHHALAGTQLGRYQVIKYLASGGMAQVLLARSSGIEGFERHVVIKRIHPERALDEHAVKMFLDEARLAAALHHANIVQVHDIGQENGEYFFAMEYIHGEDLRRLLAHASSHGEKIPFEHVVTIVSAAASALHYAHDYRNLGIVHRDVSPANIIVGYDGGVKVVDFGIAKAALRSQETQSGTLKGKISYMSPEQCMGQPVDRRSDVFALGVVLYELSTVRRLFKGSSDFLTMSQIVAGNVPKPSMHRPDLPPALEEIVMKALALDADDRYQSAEEMRMALDRSGPRSSTSELADYMRMVFGRRSEPWLDDDDEPEISVFDFDTAATGVASGPDRILTPPPGSLMARAKRKVAVPGGVPVIDVASGASWDEASSSQAEAPAPVAVRRVPTRRTPRRALTRPVRLRMKRAQRWPYFVVGGATVLIAATLTILLLPDREPAQPTPAPAPPPVQAAPIEQPVAPAPLEPPAVEQPKPQTVKAKRAKKPETKKPTAKKASNWDPTTLLPK